MNKRNRNNFDLSIDTVVSILGITVLHRAVNNYSTVCHIYCDQVIHVIHTEVIDSGVGWVWECVIDVCLRNSLIIDEKKYEVSVLNWNLLSNLSNNPLYQFVFDYRVKKNPLISSAMFRFSFNVYNDYTCLTAHVYIYITIYLSL